MKKVECPSCGGTGVILRYLCRIWNWHHSTANLCPKCKGFGFILMEPAEFAKRKSNSRRYGRSTRFIAFGECKEFTGLVKVRNIDRVYTSYHDVIPYGLFYKEHKKHP